MCASSSMSLATGQDSSPRSGPSKAVCIAEPETTTPISSPRLDGQSLQNYLQAKQHRTNSTKRLSGRPPLNASASSLQSIPSVGSHVATPNLDPRALKEERHNGHRHYLRRHSHQHYHDSNEILSQVLDWLQRETAKKSKRKSKERGGHSRMPGALDGLKPSREDEHRDAASNDSDGSTDLSSLEKILERVGLGETTSGDERTGSYFSRHSSTKHRHLRKQSFSSDTEYADGDVVVPSAEVILDNSKTLGYSGGTTESQTNLHNSNKRALREKEAWLRFKNEIVRLAHTLRLKGWRQVPLDRGRDIEVERLSGALTNAVYVVKPPANLPLARSSRPQGALSKAPSAPPKLLLRIYGPQVEHLIDRENELQILRRLRRKKIGPCLLGTFINGRFEEFYDARTLTAADLRVPQTSKQIAKRMRELHDGVELLQEEREAGPFVWLNWDKWVGKCEEIITWLDSQIISIKQGAISPRSANWKERGLVCGVKWAHFRRTVEDYRRWLEKECGGSAFIEQLLVFAHNDTQYGNLLRLQPPGDSPLLTPANEHKQLVVIDFEYASANVRGIEFANHFTEWCYNYHDAERSYACNTAKYPTPDEQRRFLKSYIQHRPFIASSPSLVPGTPQTGSVTSFVLDSRAPPSLYLEEESVRAVEDEVDRLVHETRIWRMANSAQWVAWGIVQAKVPGLDEALKSRYQPATPSSLLLQRGTSAASETTSFNEGPEKEKGEKGGEQEEEEEGENDDAGEFDYLAYAQDRALFFWADALQLGIVKRDDLPKSLLERIKIVEY